MIRMDQSKMEMNKGTLLHEVKEDVGVAVMDFGT